MHLDHVRYGRAHEDYTRPERFFDRTFMTKALLDLSSQVVRRPVRHQGGDVGGLQHGDNSSAAERTHSLTALYHLAKGGDTAKAWKGVNGILQKAQISTIEQANVAVFVGTEFDVIDGRGGNGEPLRKTPWGEIAWQLGGAESFKARRATRRSEGRAPAATSSARCCPTVPALILMDELLNFISRGRKSGMRDELFNFMQNLCEEARARDNMVVCASIPASELEMNPRRPARP